MFQIGEFSKMSRTTVKTLRYYDEIGLLKPEAVDDFTGYRFYSTKQLLELHKIQELRQIGLPIEQIKLIVEGFDERAILEKRKSEILKQISEEYSQLSQLEFILTVQREDYFMNYSATLKELPECVVYSKKITITSYDDYFSVIPEIGASVMKKYPDLKCIKPAYCFIRYLDKEYNPNKANIELCEAVDKMKPDFDDIHFKNISSVKAVSVMHKGSYFDFDKAYAFAFDWIEKNGYRAVDAPRQNYIDGIWNKENEADWLTEIQIPIEVCQ